MLLKKHSIIALLFVVASSFVLLQQKPTLYIIGDSTVRNGDGSGRNGQWGWGSLLSDHFDTTKISIRNHAIGGRSSRTFITEGRWDKILETLKPGDYVIMQFGHNDGGALDDTARARGTIKGIGEESKEIYNPIRKQQEVVHTYGWYMRKYVNDAKAKGAIPIICSPVPRNNPKNGKIARDTYGTWAKEVADQGNTFFIPLNEMVAVQYEKMDTTKLNTLFYGDHTHTSKDGAIINAQTVAEGVKALDKCDLKKFLR